MSTDSAAFAVIIVNANDFCIRQKDSGIWTENPTEQTLDTLRNIKDWPIDPP
jgi:hypothetical protein